MRERFLMLLFLLPLTGFTQTIPLDPAVHTGRLPNGFNYFIRKNAEPQKRATLYLVVKAGSILENDNQLGLAHFMEHMSFNGTRHFPKNELVEYLQKSGIRFGADLNAYTSFDETVYQLPIPTDDPALFNNGLQIMRDWAGEATLDVSEIDKERGVVLEEKRLHKGAGDRLMKQQFPFQVNGSRYGSRFPIGTEQVLTTFKKADILSFYKDWYRPDLEALIIVGDVDIAAVEKKVKAFFSGMRNPKAEKSRVYYRANLLHKSRFLTLTDIEQPQTSVQIDFKTNALYQSTKADYRAALLRNLCGQLLSERLSDISKAPGTPILNTQGGYRSVIRGLDALSVEFAPKDGQLRAGFDLVYGALLQIRRYGFSADAIQRAKKAYTSQMAALLREKNKQNSTALADELKRHFLVNEPAPGISYEYKLVTELLPELTPSVINAEIAKLIGTTDRDIILTAPESQQTTLPDEAVVNGWIAGLQKQPVMPYTEKKSNGSLMGSLPVPGKIVSETTDEPLGLTEWRLSNGAKVILKPTAFKNDEVCFTVFSPGGTSLYSDPDFESAANAAGIIASSGLGGHDATNLSQLLAGRQVQVQPFIGERSEGFHGASSKADLQTAFQLLYLYFAEPRKDTAMFTNIISRSSQIIANRYHSPQAIFQDSIAAVLGNYNNRRTGPSLQKLSRVSLDRLYDIYKERFANAGDFTFVFTGSFTVNEIRPLVERYIASLSGGGQSEMAKDNHIAIPSGRIIKNIYAGREDRATVLLVYSGGFKFSEENNHKLAALRDVIQFRMIERLREAEGGAYAPSVQFQREHTPDDRYQFLINFGCAPANVDKLVTAALEEIEKIKNSGPAADDMLKFHAEEARQFELNKQENGYWLNYLSTKLQYGEDPHSILSGGDLIKKISSADVKQAANDYLSGKNLIRFILLPESQK